MREVPSGYINWSVDCTNGRDASRVVLTVVSSPMKMDDMPNLNSMPYDEPNGTLADDLRGLATWLDWYAGVACDGGTNGEGGSDP